MIGRFPIGFKPITANFRSAVAQTWAAPTNFQATAGDALINLSWDAISGAAGYEIAVGTSNDPTNWFEIGIVTSYELGGLLNGTQYYVRVRAIGGNPTSSLARTPANTSGYQQVETDAGWRFPNRTLDQDNTQFNQAYGGSVTEMTRAIRGIYNSSGGFPTFYLSAGSGPMRRFRARMRDTTNLNINDWSFYFRNQNKEYSNNAWYLNWYNGGNIELWERLNGTDFLRATGTSTTRSENTTYLVEIRDNGNNIEVFINGSSRLTHSSTSGANNVHFGIAIFTGPQSSAVWFSVDIAGSSSVTIQPGGIATAEAFGTATLRSQSDVLPGGIATAEAFGTATVRSTSIVLPGGIASEEAFGTATLSLASTILPGGIASAETFGTATLSSSLTVSPGGIASAEAFGTTATLSGTIVYGTGIASAEAFGTATINTSNNVTITATGIASGEAFGTATLSSALTVSVTGIGSAETFGTTTLQSNATVLPGGIDTAEAFGTPTISINTAVVLSVTGIASSETFGNLTMVSGSVISVTGIATAEAFGTPTLLRGSTIAPTGIASAEAFGTSTLTFSIRILPTSITSEEAFGNATLVAGSRILPTGIPTGEIFGTTTLSSAIRVFPTSIATSEAFGTAVLSYPSPTVYVLMYPLVVNLVSTDELVVHYEEDYSILVAAVENLESIVHYEEDYATIVRVVDEVVPLGE